MQDFHWPNLPSKTIKKEISYQEMLEFYVDRILEGQEELSSVDVYVQDENGHPCDNRGGDGYGGGSNRYHISSVQRFLQAIQECKPKLVRDQMYISKLWFENPNYYSELSAYHLRMSEIFAKLAQKQTKEPTWGN